MPAKTSKLSLALVVLLTLTVTVGAAGCGGKKKPTQKELALKQWNQTRARVLHGLAKDQFETGNYDKSKNTVREALALDPESAPLHILAAKLAMEEGRLEVADAELKLARQFDEKSGEADYLSGVVYQRWQKIQVAHDFYHSAAEKDPTELAYLMAEGEMLVAMERIPDALALYQSKLDKFEHSATLRHAIGQLQIQGGRYHEAVETLRQASILATDDPSIREHFALALYYDRQYREAVDVISRLVAKDPFDKRADLFATLGESQMHLGRYREARAAFDRATQLDPNRASAWLSLAKASLQLGDQKRVETSIRRAMTLNPANADAQLLLGYLRLRQDKLSDALAAFKKASALNEADTVSICMVGYVLEKLGRNDEAVRYYGQALKLRPNDELAAKLMASVDVNE